MVSVAIQLPYTGVTTSETVPTPYLGSEKIQLPYTALAQAAFISAIDPSTKEDKSNKGYAPLDGTTLLPTANLPSHTHTIANVTGLQSTLIAFAIALG